MTTQMPEKRAHEHPKVVAGPAYDVICSNGLRALERN
jgi:hypothetical protein